MLWRAGSGYRLLIHTTAFRKTLKFQFRCSSKLAITEPSPLPQNGPSREEKARPSFTGRIPKGFLSSFSVETASFIFEIEKLFAANASKDTILSAFKVFPLESKVFSQKKKVCAFAQEMVKNSLPEQALFVLYLAHRIDLVLPHNQYEQVAYQLATKGHWKPLQNLTTFARKATGHWSLRLLNWALRSCIETQEYGFLTTALTELDKHGLKPTRRTFHLLIEGHLRNSDLERARECLVQMQKSGFELDKTTYVTVLSAYRALGPNEAVEEQAFNVLQNTGVQSDTIILNGILRMRIDDGDVAGALRFLDMLSLSPRSRDDAGGVNGNAERKAEVPSDPHPVHITHSGHYILPDNATFNILLMLLAHHEGQLPNVLQVLRQMVAAGLYPDPETIATLIVAYSTANMTSTALSLIYELCKRHHISADRNQFLYFGPLLNTIADELPKEVLSVCPNVDIFNALLRAILPLKGLTGMRRILHLMRDAHIIPDASTTQIIITYLHEVEHIRPRSLVNALHILTAFPTYEASLTIQHLNTILHSLLRREINLISTTSWNSTAQRVRFGHFPRLNATKPNIPSPHFDPTAGISLGSFQRRISDILEPIVRTLVERNVMSDRVTFALRIRRDAVVKLDIKSAQRAFDIMVSRGIQANAFHYSALIEGYATLGSMEEAKRVMDRAAQVGVKPNLIMYSILIKGYGRLGQPELAKQTFTEMVTGGIKPDYAAIDAVVSAYWFVKQYRTARMLLLDLWPLVAPFPPELKGAPLRVLVQHLRKNNGTAKMKPARPIESPRERQRRASLKHAMNHILTDLRRWQEVLEAVSWAQADIGLDYRFHAEDNFGTDREKD